MKYTVIYRSYYSAEVEANSFEEARDIADEMDGSEFEAENGWDLDLIIDEEGNKEIY